MKKFLILWTLIMVFMTSLAAIPLLAQEAEDVWPIDLPLNDVIVVAIQSLFGIGLMTVVNLVKAGIKKIIPTYDQWKTIPRHALMYGVTLILSVIVSAVVLSTLKMFDVTRLILYSLYTWFYINQFWKMLKNLIKKLATASPTSIR